MNQRFRVLTSVFSVAMLAALSNAAAASASAHKRTAARPTSGHPAHVAAKSGSTKSVSTKSVSTKSVSAKSAHAKSVTTKSPTAKPSAAKPVAVKSAAAKSTAAKPTTAASVPLPKPRPVVEASAPAAPQPALSGDAAIVKQALDLARKGKTGDAMALKASIGDPIAQTLVEWLILRNSDAGFSRYASFIADNPDWPGIRMMRRRAESLLWQERRDAAAVRRFISDDPVSDKGRFALARVLLADGDRDGAQRWVRETWRAQELSERLESDALTAFPDLLTRDDHRARMDKRIGAKDLAGAMRAARRLGGDDVAVVKACAAVAASASTAQSLLDAVASDARQDLGYTLCRSQWLMRGERYAEAARLMLAASPATMALQDTDEWWRQRRVLARKLLDLGDSASAYQVVRDAALPANENYRAEFFFLPGWIALRYLDEPATARALFAHIDDGSANPIVLARANYWRGRAAEALGDTETMRAAFETAARHPTAYYGQLARARLGLDDMTLRTPSQAAADESATLPDARVRAADMLYTIGERDLVPVSYTHLDVYKRQPIGRAAPPTRSARPTRRRPSTPAPPSTRSPITASSPARGSVSTI